MSFKVNEVDGKFVPNKKHISLKNIAVADLTLVDVNPETGEKKNITQDVLAEIPNDIELINFKITIELVNNEESSEES